MTLERAQVSMDPAWRFQVPETPEWFDWITGIASILGVFFELEKRMRGRRMFPHFRSCVSWVAGLVVCCIAVPVVFFAYLLGMAADSARKYPLPHMSSVVEWLSPPVFVLLVQPIWRACFRMPLGVFSISLIVRILPDFKLSHYILRRYGRRRSRRPFPLSAAKLAVLEACSQTRCWFGSLALCQKNTREAEGKRLYIPIVPIPVWSNDGIGWWTAVYAAGAGSGRRLS